ncbi:MAG TPA: hypothetical protein VF042_09220, partial [Gemmatimonadaceae bacterium]
MQTHQPNVSAEQIREQARNAAQDAKAAAEQARAAAQDAAPSARITTPDGRTIVIGPPGRAVGIGETRTDPMEVIPQRAENIAIAFFIMVAAVIIGLPIMRAIGKRIERGAPQPASIPNDVRNQLQQISASVEAIAIEVERISEAQRFTTKMLAEKAP